MMDALGNQLGPTYRHQENEGELEKLIDSGFKQYRQEKIRPLKKIGATAIGIPLLLTGLLSTLGCPNNSAVDNQVALEMHYINMITGQHADAEFYLDGQQGFAPGGNFTTTTQYTTGTTHTIQASIQNTHDAWALFRKDDPVNGDDTDYTDPTTDGVMSFAVEDHGNGVMRINIYKIGQGIDMQWARQYLANQRDNQTLYTLRKGNVNMQYEINYTDGSTIPQDIIDTLRTESNRAQTHTGNAQRGIFTSPRINFNLSTDNPNRGKAIFENIMSGESNHGGNVSGNEVTYFQLTIPGSDAQSSQYKSLEEFTETILENRLDALITDPLYPLIQMGGNGKADFTYTIDMQNIIQIASQFGPIGVKFPPGGSTVVHTLVLSPYEVSQEQERRAKIGNQGLTMTIKEAQEKSERHYRGGNKNQGMTHRKPYKK